VRWSSRLVQVKRVAEGASVGYGARWTAPRASTIGLVPVGYADGYPTSRAAGDGCAAFVRVLRPDGTPAEAPVVGAVNMDQITVDLTGLGAARMEDWLGCEVELISRDRRSRAHLPAVAAASGMIVHECLTRLNPRIPRSVSSAVSVSLVSGPESTVTARAGASDGPRLGSAAG
jgi:alanine racemase